MKNIFKKYFIYFRERRMEEEREGKKHLFETEASIGCLLDVPQGTEPATQACALTGNQTSGLLVCSPMPNQLSRTGRGSMKSI